MLRRPRLDVVVVVVVPTPRLTVDDMGWIFVMMGKKRVDR